MASFDALFDALTDQERPRRILAGILSSGTIPNAFLFTGIDGIGKRSAALWFARAANCVGRAARQEDGLIDRTDGAPDRPDRIEPCDECRACLTIKAGGHPDIIVIAPEKDIIKISRIRELLQRIAFKPHQANLRVILIVDAQTMNREASNALLKALEEPPPQTVFILTTGHAADLLPTVVSRCQQVRFNPVSVESITQCLVDRHGVAEDVAGMAAIMADGSFAGALALIDDSRAARKMGRTRKWLLDELEELPTRPLSLVLAFSEMLARDKARLPAYLNMISSYLRDTLISDYCPEKIINRDLTDRITSPTGRLHEADRAGNRMNRLINKLEAVAETEAALARNANQRLALDILALKLADITL